MRKGLVIAIVVGSAILLACYLSFRTRPKPLHPITVTWQEVGEICGVVDLDADGNDELLVTDPSEQVWWVQFRLPSPIRQKIPVPKDAELYSAGGQMAVFRCPETSQAFLVTRKGGKWFLKDLGKVDDAKVMDADHDGQVNDAIVVLKKGKRTVFSRMKDGTIVERPDLPSWQADLDSDGKNDVVYETKQGLQVKFASGRKAFLELPYWRSISVLDMDGDKMAEIVVVEWIRFEWVGSIPYLFHCWHYENGRLRRSSSQTFGGGAVIGGLFRGREGAHIVAVTREGRLMKIWEVRWRKGKWTKRLMGLKALEPGVDDIRLIRAGQYWLMFTENSLPKWQRWLWSRIGQPLQRFLPFLREPKTQFSVWGWDGRQRWSFLGRWRYESIQAGQWVDMDGDGRKELALAFPKKVFIAKFEDGRWRTRWVEVPFVEYVFKEEGDIPSGLRYGEREWAIFQEANSHRCVAIALERER
jgi:hypothetical protein